MRRVERLARLGAALLALGGLRRHAHHEVERAAELDNQPLLVVVVQREQAQRRELHAVAAHHAGREAPLRAAAARASTAHLRCSRCSHHSVRRPSAGRVRQRGSERTWTSFAASSHVGAPRRARVGGRWSARSSRRSRARPATSRCASRTPSLRSVRQPASAAAAFAASLVEHAPPSRVPRRRLTASPPSTTTRSSPSTSVFTSQSSTGSSNTVHE